MMDNMLPSFIITFRKALEAALIIGIIAALIASAGVAVIFKTIYGGLEGTAEQLFEGAAALTAAAVLTYMIFWMAGNSKKIKGEHP